MSDLDVLVAEPVLITIAGVQQTVNRIRVRQMTRVMEIADPIKALIFKNKPTKGNVASQKPIDITSLVLAHSETLITLIGEIQAHKNPGVTPEWVADLEIDELVTLVTAVLEVNLDFFIQRVLPSLAAALGKLHNGIQLQFLGGSIPSPS